MRAVLPSLAAALVLGGTTEGRCQPYSQLARADGGTIFSREFLDDHRAAEARASQTKSVEPLLALLSRYNKPEEVAELELTLGLHYSQRTGMVDHAKAVTHLTRAMGYRLPEHVWLQVAVWRSGSLWLLDRYPEALKDALRVLVGLSYHDMTQPCPRFEFPVLPIFSGAGSDSPENIQRMQDYHRYREHIDRQFTLSVLKYSAIDLTHRVQSRARMSDDDVRTALLEVSPDRTRPEIVFDWLRSPNPWPFCR